MTFSQEEIAQKVKGVIHEVLRVDQKNISPESRIKEDLGADSLDTVSLLMALEEEFAHTISDEEAVSLSTVGSIVAFITTKAAAAKEVT